MGDYRPSHFGICVRDLDRSLRFFCDGLGFEKAEGFELDSAVAPGLERSLEVAGPVRIMSQFIQNDTMKIELLLFLEPGVSGTPSATRNQVGLTHLSFYVDDLDVATEASRRLRCDRRRGDALPAPASTCCSSPTPTGSAWSSWPSLRDRRHGRGRAHRRRRTVPA